MYLTTRDPIRLIMGAPAVSLARTTDLLVAADLMRQEEVGALAVLDGAELTGLISERDIVRAVADGAEPCATPVAAAMAERPVAVGSETSIGDALDLMLATGVRHLPVVEGHAVVGMLSMRDVLGVVAHDRAPAGS